MIGVSSLFTKMTREKWLLVTFFSGFVIRLIPEVLAFPNPIGFDTVYYAARMKSCVVWPHWSTLFTSAWLLHALIVPLYTLSNADPFLLLKIVAPLLYGLNVTGIYYFADKALSWDLKKSLFAGGFFVVQLASLRISWDLLRNTLGMGILLFTLPFINKLDSKRGIACFISLSLLTVFAHQYAAVTLLAIAVGSVFWRFVRRKQGRANIRRILVVLPALTVFLAGIYLRIFPIRYVVETNIIGVGDVVRAAPGRLFFLTNYLSVKTSVQYYPTYWDLALHVTALFGLLYLPYLFLVWKGFFRNDVLDFWTALLLVGSFGCLVIPFFALDLWNRWMFMLVYPFTFYAVNGLETLLGKRNRENLHLGTSKLSGKMKGLILLTVLLGGFYLAIPVLMNTVNAENFSTPVSNYFSSAPTVPYQDVDGVVQAMLWLDESMNNHSCVILHHAFREWGSLYLDKSHTIVVFSSDAELALSKALEHGFSCVYLVWWNQNVGWYDITIPDGFEELQNFSRISVFEYVG